MTDLPKEDVMFLCVNRTMILGQEDEVLKCIVDTFRQLQFWQQTQNPLELELYRVDAHNISIRIVSPFFQKCTYSGRYIAIWKDLSDVPSEYLRQISILVLVTPREALSDNRSVLFEKAKPSEVARQGDKVNQTNQIIGETDNKLSNLSGVLMHSFTGASVFRDADWKIELYRFNEVSIRIRIVSSVFQGFNRMERHSLIYDLLSDAMKEAISDLTYLVLVTPYEEDTWESSIVFEEEKPGKKKEAREEFYLQFFNLSTNAHSVKFGPVNDVQFYPNWIGLTCVQAGVLTVCMIFVLGLKYRTNSEHFDAIFGIDEGDRFNQAGYDKLKVSTCSTPEKT